MARKKYESCMTCKRGNDRLGKKSDRQNTCCKCVSAGGYLYYKKAQRLFDQVVKELTDEETED